MVDLIEERKCLMDWFDDLKLLMLKMLGRLLMMMRGKE